jgi:hypothetical protein
MASLAELVATFTPSARRRWKAWLADQVDPKGIWFVDPPSGVPGGRRVVMGFDPAKRPDLASWVRSAAHHPEKEWRVAEEWRRIETAPPFLFLLYTIYRPAAMRVNVLFWAAEPIAREAVEAVAATGVFGLSPGPEGSSDVAFLAVTPDEARQLLAKHAEHST